MPLTEPATEIMSRAGRGTEAETEAGRSRALTWSQACDRLGGGWFWLATVRPDGAPHTAPVLGVWAVDAFYVSSKDTARKSRNLDAEPRCVLSADLADLHLVVEGEAHRVTGTALLERASGAFESVYGWPTTVVGETLDAEYGAPTSGGPPYRVYEITPTTAFGFPATGEGFAPTRWRFDP